MSQPHPPSTATAAAALSTEGSWSLNTGSRHLLTSTAVVSRHQRAASASFFVSSNFSVRTIPATRLFSSSSTMNNQANPTASQSVIPRAAVSTLVRWEAKRRQPSSTPLSSPKYLLVQRGNPPNQGMWSLPGGKLEYGETTLEGAMRELLEETKWGALDDDHATESSPDTRYQLAWHESPMCTSDAIGEGYHYLIAQCFAQVHVVQDSTASSSIDDETHHRPPALTPADDAAAVDWFSKEEILAMEATITPGVLKVVERAESLSKAGLLSTTILMDTVDQK